LLPVQTIEVQGELHHHSSQQLSETLAKRLSGGFLTADLTDLKQAAEELPWVGGASIRRVWPDRLQVRVVEHKPVARWKGDRLVTAEGVVFRAGAGSVPAGLPLLEGDERRARELVQRYLEWRDRLMLAGQLIDTLGVDARGAWHLALVSKARLELGTDDIEPRLARYINAAPQLDAAGRADLIDLRYSNGFAVKWVGSTAAPAAESPVDPKTQAKTGAKTGAKTQTKTGSKTQAQAHAKSQVKAATRPKPRAPGHGSLQAQAAARPKPRAPGSAQAHPRAPALPPAHGLTQAGPVHPEAKPQERTGKKG
jgi:cell division protein FtsQ